jgi:two-component sensor histidine kinase
MAGKIEPVEYYENKVLTKNGEERLIAWYNTVFRDEEGNITNTMGAGVDITDSRNAEMQIQASLKEKEILLQEIHHRVKNNMTVIHSMLELQSGYIKDIRYKDMFRESMARIKSMALIHEKLYRSKDLTSINFSEYISDMTDDIFISYGLNSGKVRLKKDIDQITLGIDTAIPCGLIVNELLSNSLKYAFPEGMEGEITVALCMNDKEEVEHRLIGLESYQCPG